MSYSIDFLTGAAAAVARTVSRKPRFVAHVEVAPHQFEELDADSAEHGRVLAQAWLATGAAMTAAVRRVFPGGTLGPVIGHILTDDDLGDYRGHVLSGGRWVFQEGRAA